MKKKNKLIVRIIAVILAILFLGSVLFTVLSSLLMSARASDEMDQLEAQQEENELKRQHLEEERRQLNAERVKLQASILSLEDDISAIQQQKEEYDSLIVLTEDEIDMVVQQINVLVDEMQLKTEELNRLSEEREKRWEEFCMKLREMEESSSFGYLDVLFGKTGSFSELLSGFEMVDEVNNRSESIIADMEEFQIRVVYAQQALYDTKLEWENKLSEEEDLRKEYETLREDSTRRIAEMEGELERKNATAEEQRLLVLELERQIRQEEEEAQKIAERIEELERLEELMNAGVFATGTYLWPSSTSYYVTSRFGSRLHPILKYWRMHNGVDIGANYGTDIYASDGGVVVVSESSYSYGEYVMIAHGSGRYTLYAHMSKRLVSVDDIVKQGDVIGKVGSTGQSTGPHIHFEIVENDVRVDPLQYFSNYVLLG